MTPRKHRRALIRIFEMEDIAAARKLHASTGGLPVSWEASVIGFHKARAAADFVREELRAKSRKWLRDRGLKLLHEPLEVER